MKKLRIYRNRKNCWKCVKTFTIRKKSLFFDFLQVFDQKNTKIVNSFTRLNGIKTPKIMVFTLKKGIKSPITLVFDQKRGSKPVKSAIFGLES